MQNVKIYSIFDAYSMNWNLDGSYNSNVYVIEEDKVVLLKESKQSLYENIENFVGGGEAVDFDVLAYAGTNIVFSEYSKLKDGIVNISITTSLELDTEKKALIEKFYSKKEYAKIFEFKVKELEIDPLSFYTNTEDYEGNNILYSRFNIKDLENLILQLESKVTEKKLYRIRAESESLEEKRTAPWIPGTLPEESDWTVSIESSKWLGWWSGKDWNTLGQGKIFTEEEKENFQLPESKNKDAIWVELEIR
jgi:hypothetical protein